MGFFEKEVTVGRARITRRVTDWGKVLATIFWVFVGLAILGQCAG